MGGGKNGIDVHCGGRGRNTHEVRRAGLSSAMECGICLGWIGGFGDRQFHEHRSRGVARQRRQLGDALRSPSRRGVSSGGNFAMNGMARNGSVPMWRSPKGQDAGSLNLNQTGCYSTSSGVRWRPSFTTFVTTGRWIRHPKPFKPFKNLDEIEF